MSLNFYSGNRRLVPLLRLAHPFRFLVQTRIEDDLMINKISDKYFYVVINATEREKNSKHIFAISFQATMI